MQISEFFITPHALSRALDMDITGDMIRDCLTGPREITQSYRDRHFVRGKITCVVSPDNAVKTILWSSLSALKGDISKGEYGGRTYQEVRRTGAKGKSAKGNRRNNGYSFAR